MHTQKTLSRDQIAGRLLLGIAASGALAIAPLSGAGAATATCSSISGVRNRGGCTSTPTNFAVGLGNNAAATAVQGMFKAAAAIGDNSQAVIQSGNASLAVAAGEGAFAL